MKKMTMVFCAALLAVSVNAFAWGKKETTKSTKDSPVVAKAVVAAPVAAKEVVAPAAAPVEQKRTISFDRLVKLLLNEGVSVELGLSVEQKATIAAANDGLRTELKAVRDEFNTKTAEIRAEYEAKLKPFKETLRSKTDDVKKTKVEELNNALTKEQQEKLAAVMQDPKKFLK
jgi:hypothetical protein